MERYIVDLCLIVATLAFEEAIFKPFIVKAVKRLLAPSAAMLVARLDLVMPESIRELTKEQIEEAIAETLEKYTGEDWFSYSDVEKDVLIDKLLK